MSERAKGVDVSHWKPVLNWAALATGASFLGVKTTESTTYVDPTFAAHQKGFRASALKMCAYYHFARGGDPIAQARHLVDTVGPLDPRERLCLDLERDITDLGWVTAFFGELLSGECAASRPLLYTSERIWATLGDPPTWDFAGEVDLWLPRYSEREPIVPKPWSRWAIWQNSEQASFPGVDGQCDGNLFNGDEAALDAYVATGILPASPTTSPVA